MNTMNKKRVLFVVAEFWQAGGERQTYEIHKSLTNKGYDIHFLSLLPLKSDITKEDYYYYKNIELGAKVDFLLDIKKEPNYSIKHKVLNRLGLIKLPITHDLVSDYLDQFNVIFSMGEYVFPSIEKYLSKSAFKNTHIFIQHSIFQVPEKFNSYDKSKAYNFISSFFPEETRLEFAKFTNYNHIFFPLSINIKNDTSYKIRENKKTKTLGIFTRLAKSKPLDVFFYALHIILSQGEDVILNVYGSGDPNELELNRIIKQLSIQDRVFFKGHQTEMIKTALDEEVDLVWFHSYYGFPGGFASFDFCASGIPQLFWNFTPNYKHEEYPEFPSFSNLLEFVDKTTYLLRNKNELERLGQKQKAYILKNRNINNYIQDIEKLL